MLLNESQQMIRDMARSFAQETLAPTAAQRDQACRFPKQELAEMGKLGLLGMTVPEEWGGAGADYVSFALAIEEIAAGDGAISTIMSVHNSVACLPILKFGTPEQKEQYLTPLAEGRLLGAFALTEPEAGSDASALRTKAEKKGGTYIINGTKQFITSGKYGDITIVFAVTDPAAGKKGISAFIVPTGTPGYTAPKVEHKMGQRCSDTAQLVFDNMEIPAANLLGKEGEGYKIALSNLEGGRIGIAAQSVGMARAAYELAAAYAKERKTFGKALMEHQAIAFRLAEMATQVEAARQMVLHAACLRDAGLPCLKEAAMAKLFAAEMAERVCSDALQVFGGYGYLSEFPVERICRDVRVCKIYEGTSDIQRIIIAREIGG